MVALELMLLGRDGCHLCEEMLEVVRQVAAEEAIRLEVRDVDSDPDLRSRYGDEIPVLFVNGRRAFKYRVGLAELRRRLGAERARGWRRFLARLR